MIPVEEVQETHFPGTNLAATSSSHYHYHVPALDQLSLHGDYLPDQQRSIYDQYQLVHEPVTYMHGEVAIQSNILPSPQPLANIPGDQCNVTQPQTGMQSNDQYRHGDYGDDLDFTTPCFSPRFGFLSPLDDNIMDSLFADSSNAQLESSPIPPRQSIIQTHGVVHGSGTSNFAASTEDFYLPSPPIEWCE